MPVLTAAAAWHAPWHKNSSFPGISLEMPREARLYLIAMDTPSPSCHLSRLHWPWWAGTTVHGDQREEHQDGLNPEEKGRATSLEQCQSQLWGPLPVKLTGCWQNGSRKILKKLFDVQSLADATSLLHPSSAAACLPKWGYWHVSPHAYLQMPSISMPKWLENGSYEKGSHAYSARPLCQTWLLNAQDVDPLQCCASSPSTKQKEQSGFSCTGSLTFPIGKKSLTLSRDLGEHTRNFLIGTAAMLMRFTEHVDLSPCALSCRISMWSGKWAGFSFPSLAELAARQAVASLCRVGHSTAGHGTAGVPARGGCRWGTTCNITSCPQIITARQASDLQSCSSLHFSISPLKRFQEKIKIQSLSAGRQSRQCWAAARQSAALSLPPATVSWCASLILMLPMFRFHLYFPPIFLPLGKI